MLGVVIVVFALENLLESIFPGLELWPGAPIENSGLVYWIGAALSFTIAARCSQYATSASGRLTLESPAEQLALGEEER